MTHKQHPIGSGFTAASSATDVLAGIDLTGRQIIVTAGHVGLGLETTRALSRAGASVVVGARSPERAAAAVADLPGVQVHRLDLLDPRSVADFAAGYLDTGRPLHTLVNNAGIMGGPLVRDGRGYEAQFATNHLGHFQLTNALLPALRAATGARVVELSSWGHHLSDIRWDEPHFEDESSYDGMLAYGQSKTANVLFAVELDRLWSDDGIRGYALHPGGILGTNLAPWMPDEGWKLMGLIDEHGNVVIDPDRDLKTPQQGAATTVWAATSPLLDDIGGVFLQNSDIAPLEDIDEPVAVEFGTGPFEMTVGVTRYAVDPESAQRLWGLSEKLLAV
ncbi:SDR family NAD(P)-dependent oxidoreductase [Mycolicibacterium frederiksbergense]|uniref:SDR family NAD(P)-dependent oxidoreductase n=1 Tax=Mycolicibacterium frederiksbergense TaxID=117567 RepID=A0A6H0SBJ5_9MYCO|nr:SDR family NAD(P)-dependent oxidoreductase [Mycolicibacterium frederiksbergense]QIV84893.1 SDR family NAD(P)-dependent oxidoreductase [Mycolicibacterium frederiksbergense]